MCNVYQHNLVRWFHADHNATLLHLNRHTAGSIGAIRDIDSHLETITAYLENMLPVKLHNTL